ncbi:ROK family transcriptional regulator [Bifidobacterium ruminantium]|uniref:ROK family transcriptional regulator n=1 Tax=Bifidobacterium ruminantium TaxID=78346 RepID=UPI001959F5FB|nr:ROK family transcriptional regulator [Bifidobacterium ruminantium]MBM6746199.1 ROK family transcriptional regulator [Bifidobacterium ruminantium]
MKAVPTMAVKELNKRALTRYLYTNGPATKQVLERELGLSLPTITQNLRALEQEGLVGKGEQLESTGGRKAQTFVFESRCKAAIGVAMRANRLNLCAIDLHGHVIARHHAALPYRNTDAYYQKIGGIINDFAAKVERGGSGILGVAFAIQGIVSADGTTISFGSIMGNTGVKLGTIAQNVRYPSIMIHDSDASAMTELWLDHALSDAVCVYLEMRPGGAVIIDGQLYQGPNLRNGVIEHMTLVPGGNKCYCGQYGCMDTYCSPETLLEDGESLSGFFSVLRQGEHGHRQRFDHWLANVAQAVSNVRALLAGDIIIGGEAARYLDSDDIDHLKALVEEKSAFHDTHFVLRKSLCVEDQNIIGAALRFVQSYVADICNTEI